MMTAGSSQMLLFFFFFFQDIQHLSPATDFYKKLALDCSGQQVAVDLFLLSSQYCDLASLGEAAFLELTEVPNSGEKKGGVGLGENKAKAAPGPVRAFIPFFSSVFGRLHIALLRRVRLLLPLLPPPAQPRPGGALPEGPEAIPDEEDRL